jgi:hypothetical protein
MQNYNYIQPNITPFYKPIASYEGNLSAMQSDYDQLVHHGDYEQQRKWWDKRTPHSSAMRRGDRTVIWRGGIAAGLGQDVYGMKFYDIQEITSGIYRQHAGMLGREIDRLSGIESAGGEEAYAQQQSAAKLLGVSKQQEAARASEQTRLGGGGTGRGQAAVSVPAGAQAQAASAAEAARGTETRRGGGVAKRYLRSRKPARKILQPLGGSAVLG